MNTIRREWYRRLVVGLVLGVAAAQSASARVIYVWQAAQGAGTGESWGNAHTDLGVALGEAAKGDELWVAAGVYRGHFVIAPGVAVHGGFAGHETEFAQRNDNPETNGTILSGDILGNDNTTCEVNETWSDNEQVVVTVAPGDVGTVISGLRIERCLFRGILAEGALLKLSKCKVTTANGYDHYEQTHAIFARESHLTLEDMVLTADPGCWVSVHSERGSFFATRSRFGVVYLSCSTTVLIECNFSLGLGLQLCNSLLMDCSITGNGISMYYGSGIALGCSISSVHNPRFSGSLSLHDDQFYIGQSVFLGNLAKYGGAIDMGGSGRYWLESCTFVGNHAVERGSAIYSDFFSARAEISNSIFWDNSQALPHKPQIEAASEIRSSLVEGSGGSANWISRFGRDRGGNIDSDPQFTNYDGDRIALAAVVPGAGSEAASAATARIPPPALPDLCEVPYGDFCNCQICEEGESDILPPVPRRPDCEMAEYTALIEARYQQDFLGNPRPASGGKIGALESYPHSADTNGDQAFDIAELLRIVQFYNAGAYHCALDTEDGFAPGRTFTVCDPHMVDFAPADFIISLGELLRLIQLYNSDGYVACPEAGTEDGYCLG